LDAASDSGASDHDDITKNNTPSFSGTAEPGATVDLMKVTPVLGTTSADALGNWSIISTLLGDGVHSIFAHATDPSGNTASSDILAVSIDTAAPLASAGADQTVNEADNITLTGSFDDGSGFGAYTFHWTQTEGPFVFTTQKGNQLTFS